MTALEHVFLDLDGTLTDPAPGIIASYLHMAEAMGRRGWHAGNLRRFIGPPLREAIATILGSKDPKRIEQGVTHYREYYAVQGLLDNAVFPGVPEALAELSARGFTLHLATSKATFFAERIVDHFALKPYLAGVYGAELGGGRSTKQEVLSTALTNAGADPRRAVMVGDRHHDIDGARAHNIASIGVLWGYGSAQELAAARPHRIVIDVADLPDVVSELSRSLSLERKP